MCFVLNQLKDQKMIQKVKQFLHEYGYVLMIIFFGVAFILVAGAALTPYLNYIIWGIEQP